MRSPSPRPATPSKAKPRPWSHRDLSLPLPVNRLETESEAWAAIYREYINPLTKRSRYLCNRDDDAAIDLTQETFQRAIQSCPNPALIEHVPSYLMTVLFRTWTERRNLITLISLSDLTDFRSDSDRLIISEPSIPASQDKDMETVELLKLIDKSQSTQSFDPAKLSELFLEGYTPAEIAERWQVSIKDVRREIALMRRNVKEKLRRRCARGK